MAFEGEIETRRIAREALSNIRGLTFLGRVKSIDANRVAVMEIIGPWDAAPEVPGVQLFTSEPGAALGVSVGDTAFCVRTNDGIFALAYRRTSP